MVKSKRFLVFIISALLLFSILPSSIPIVEVAGAQEKGPRSDLQINFYGDVSEAYAALKNGEIDFLYWSLNSTILQDAQSDPNLVVTEGINSGMYEFDINNNYTIPDYPSVKSPTYEVKFRQAIAHTIDKDHIVNDILADYGVRIDQPCSALSSWWMNETYLDEGYPYKYNLTRAAELLDELGFVDSDENG